MQKIIGYALWIVILCLFTMPVMAIRDADKPGTPQRGQITFVSDRDGSNEIYTMDVDGSNPVRLTFDRTDKADPFWHPDGTILGFSAHVRDLYTLYAMDTENSNNAPARVSLDGTGNAYHGAWPNDGSPLLYHADFDGHLNIYIEQEQKSVQLTFAGNNYTPEWSPDESQIVFMSDRDGTPALYLMDADGSNQRAVIVNSGYAEYQPDWSPDGTQIVFAAVNGGLSDIAIVDIDGQNLRIFEQPGFDIAPDWSPDGSKILFQSALLDGEDEDNEIFVMESDGSHVVQLTDNDSQDTYPIWKPIP